MTVRRATQPGHLSASGDAGPREFNVALAKLLALGARNGVEDLHVAGVFSDQQAPSLNRRIRGRIYELFVALHRKHPAGERDPFVKYIDNLAVGHSGGRTKAALQGAVARAVDDFSTSEDIDPPTAKKLRKAAIRGAVEMYKIFSRLALGRSKDEARDSFAIDLWLRSIPDYWEEPEVSPEFQKLLDNAPSDKLDH
jgi:hypothetical protein